MRPAWSLIFFTTMSGLGLGLAGWIVIGLLPLMTVSSLIGVGVLTLFLIGAGLLSSTFHLGHPERAWRALSQWRSSWLSREGVLAVIVMAGLTGWFAAGYLGMIVPPMGKHCAAGADLCHGLCNLDDLCLVEDSGTLVSSADAGLLSDVCGGWWSVGKPRIAVTAGIADHGGTGAGGTGADAVGMGRKVCVVACGWYGP